MQDKIQRLLPTEQDHKKSGAGLSKHQAQISKPAEDPKHHMVRSSQCSEVASEGTASS